MNGMLWGQPQRPGAASHYPPAPHHSSTLAVFIYITHIDTYDFCFLFIAQMTLDSHNENNYNNSEMERNNPQSYQLALLSNSIA